MTPEEQKEQSREDREKAQVDVRAIAVAFGGFFLSLWDERNLGFARNHARSKRKPEEIRAELRAFYRARPRPWRWHGSA
jgi:hypothetical protein